MCELGGICLDLFRRLNNGSIGLRLLFRATANDTWGLLSVLDLRPSRRCRSHKKTNKEWSIESGPSNLANVLQSINSEFHVVENYCEIGNPKIERRRALLCVEVAG
jgi:hypothetical protein